MFLFLYEGEGHFDFMLDAPGTDRKEYVQETITQSFQRLKAVVQTRFVMSYTVILTNIS